jgi:hypothetical protein
MIQNMNGKITVQFSDAPRYKTFIVPWKNLCQLHRIIFKKCKQFQNSHWASGPYLGWYLRENPTLLQKCLQRHKRILS